MYFDKVVYLLFSTSNHNRVDILVDVHLLYIFSFLHQTTTGVSNSQHRKGCISSLFYIKPQLLSTVKYYRGSCISVSTQFRAYLFERVLFSALNRVLLIN